MAKWANQKSISLLAKKHTSLTLANNQLFLVVPVVVPVVGLGVGEEAFFLHPGVDLRFLRLDLLCPLLQVLDRGSGLEIGTCLGRWAFEELFFSVCCFLLELL